MAPAAVSDKPRRPAVEPIVPTPPAMSASAAEQPDASVPSAALQRLIAGLTGLGLVAMVIWLLLRPTPLVDHDRPPPARIRFSLDINTAPTVELAQLPGIGPAMARRIVDHRQQHGPFASIDAIAEVSGIGPVTLSQIRPFIRPIPAHSK